MAAWRSLSRFVLRTKFASTGASERECWTTCSSLQQSEVFTLSKKFVASLVVLAFVIGVLLGAAGGGSFVIWKTIRFETDAIVMAVAENTFSMVPVVMALGTDDGAERLNRL
jgi:hypothetical protein